jgi:hypothetical protein
MDTCRVWDLPRVRQILTCTSYFGEDPLILVMYFNDLFLTGAEKLIAGCKENLAGEFEMKEIGLMHYFLGLDVWKVSGEIFLGQGNYVIDILRKFRMEDCKPMARHMITNLKNIDTSYSELVDLEIYR